MNKFLTRRIFLKKLKKGKWRYIIIQLNFVRAIPSIANYKRKNILSQLRINIERIIPQIDTHTLFLVFKKKKKNRKGQTPLTLATVKTQRLAKAFSFSLPATTERTIVRGVRRNMLTLKG